MWDLFVNKANCKEETFLFFEWIYKSNKAFNNSNIYLSSIFKKELI